MTSPTPEQDAGELKARLTKLYAQLGTAGKNYDHEAVAEAIEALARPATPIADTAIEDALAVLRHGAASILTTRQEREKIARLIETLAGPTPTAPTAGEVERIARAIAPDSWMRKDEGGRGISLDIAIDHSLAAAERVIAALQFKGQSTDA